MALNESDFTDLEMMVDKNGIVSVVEGLSRMCSEKAEHARSAWQDEGLGKLWDKKMMILDIVAQKLSKHG